jgi:WD40 repeat protein
MLRHSLLWLVLFPAVPVLEAQIRPIVSSADYGKWESPGAAHLSPDGRWLAYGVNRVSEENELRLYDARKDSTRALPHATAAAFSADSRWLAWLIGVSPGEREKLQKEKKPIRTSLGLLDLSTGSLTTVEKISSFDFSPDGRFLAMRG